MTFARIAAVAVALWSACAAAQGTEVVARSIAAGCAACHGTNGVSLSQVPSLAGAPRADIVAKMQDFKKGTRQGTVMPQLAKGYTDEQIDLAAAWFANQRPSAR